MMVEPSSGDAQWQWQREGQVPHNRPGDECHGHDEVGDHDAAGSPRHGDPTVGIVVIADDDGVSGLQGEFRSGAAHGDADMRAAKVERR